MNLSSKKKPTFSRLVDVQYMQEVLADDSKNRVLLLRSSWNLDHPIDATSVLKSVIQSKDPLQGKTLEMIVIELVDTF